ncbi:hypothetical protein ACRRTK_023863 [Alexandromys fortis]
MRPLTQTSFPLPALPYVTRMPTVPASPAIPSPPLSPEKGIFFSPKPRLLGAPRYMVTRLGRLAGTPSAYAGHTFSGLLPCPSFLPYSNAHDIMVL